MFISSHDLRLTGSRLLIVLMLVDGVDGGCELSGEDGLKHIFLCTSYVVALGHLHPLSASGEVREFAAGMA